MFKESKEYNDESLQEGTQSLFSNSIAEKYVSNISADLGGTNLLAPLLQ